VRYFLELCLQSVTAAIQDLDAEILVVDNASSDDSCAMIKQLFPNVQLIENNENLGFSKGNNVGVTNAKGEYICILNPDTVVPEDAFSELINFADGIYNLGILGCQLIDGTGQFLPESKRNIPTPLVSLFKILGRSKGYYSDLDTDSIGKAPILVGAFMLIKRDVYNEVDGFDEDFFMYGEDIDLSYRILKRGYCNYYNGEISVIHFKGESTLRDKIYAKRFYGAMKLFYSKHFSSNFLLNGIVFSGIKLASIVPTKNEFNTFIYPRSLLFSDRFDEILNSKLPQPIEQISKLIQLQNESLVVLDAEKLTFKTIINTIKIEVKSKKIAFRIWPKNCKFVLGSDSAIGKGQVIKF
jgi:GT2 family glycosyltransferase